MTTRKLTLTVTLVVITIGVLLFFSFGPMLVEQRQNTVRPRMLTSISQQAASLHETLFVADLHADPYFDNKVGGSSTGEAKGGLTEFGRKVIQRAEELGMVIDLAHASPALIEEVSGVITHPVVASHTGVRGTCDNPRNLSDESVRSIAKAGGVVGIGFWATAVCGVNEEAIVRAIRYTSDLVGVEHVALGSDFDGAIETPFDVTGIARITEALLENGFPEKEIRMVMGENTLRVLNEVQKQ